MKARQTYRFCPEDEKSSNYRQLALAFTRAGYNRRATAGRNQRRGEHRCGRISILGWAARLRVRRRFGGRCSPEPRRPPSFFWPRWRPAARRARNPWVAREGRGSIPAAMAAAQTRTAETGRPAPRLGRKACRSAAPAGPARQAAALTHRAAAAAAARSETRRRREARAAPAARASASPLGAGG